MDRGMQKTHPREAGGRIQCTAQTSGLLKDEDKRRALQSVNHSPNSFDIIDSLLVKLSEENNELSHDQGTGLVISDSQVKDASKKDMKMGCDNNIPTKSKFKRKDLSQPRNQEHDEFQVTNHLLDPMATQDYLLTKFPEAKEQDRNQVIGNSRPLASSLDPHPTLISMDDKQKIDGEVLSNFPQNFSLEEGQSKEHGVLGSRLADYRSIKKLQPDDISANINLPHRSSHLPSPQTDLSTEQQKEPEVKVRRKKRKKKNEVREFLKRNKEESFQITVESLLKTVEVMKSIVQNLINTTRESKP